MASIKSFSAFKHGHTLRKILAPTSSVQQLLQRQLSSLSDREKNVKIGWTRRRKCLEERQTYDLFEKICRAALTQIQDLLQKTPNEAKQNLGTRFNIFYGPWLFILIDLGQKWPKSNVGN